MRRLSARAVFGAPHACGWGAPAPWHAVFRDACLSASNMCLTLPLLIPLLHCCSTLPCSSLSQVHIITNCDFIKFLLANPRSCRRLHPQPSVHHAYRRQQSRACCRRPGAHWAPGGCMSALLHYLASLHDYHCSAAGAGGGVAQNVASEGRQRCQGSRPGGRAAGNLAGQPGGTEGWAGGAGRRFQQGRRGAGRPACLCRRRRWCSVGGPPQ